MRTEEKLLEIPDFLVTLIAISDNPGSSISDIHYKTTITYSHMHIIKKLLLKKGWIEVTIDGQKHILSLTEQGKHLLSKALELMEVLGIDRKDIYKFKAKEKKSLGDSNDKGQGEVQS